MRYKETLTDHATDRTEVKEFTSSRDSPQYALVNIVETLGRYLYDKSKQIKEPLIVNRCKAFNDLRERNPSVIWVQWIRYGCRNKFLILHFTF